jgi:hypothetical protein
MSTTKIPQNPPKHICELCHYNTCSLKDYAKHLSTQKHILNSLSTFSNIAATEKSYQTKIECKICNKEYKDRTGLWRHNKICKNKTEVYNLTDKDKDNNLTDKELIIMLINDNKDLRNLVIEQSKEKDEFKNLILEIVKKDTTINNNNTNSNNTNSHNKTFNMQFFLNETCKGAMNIMDFVDSIKLQLSDLENVGKLGYVEGISKIITTNLKALDVTQRPIHCADNKREILYVKDDDKWEKEDDNKKKIRKAIKRVVCKNQRLIPKFKEAHPDCLKSASIFSDQYNKIFVESMGGSCDNDLEKEDKIIRNISKIITIDKK